MNIHSQQVNQYSLRNFKKRIWRERRKKASQWFLRNHETVLVPICLVACIGFWVAFR